MSADKTHDEYASKLPFPEGSRWLHVWPDPLPGNPLLALTIQCECVGVRKGNLAWVLLMPTECSKLMTVFTQIKGAVLHNGIVSIPLD